MNLVNLTGTAGRAQSTPRNCALRPGFSNEDDYAIEAPQFMPSGATLRCDGEVIAVNLFIRDA